MLDLTQYLPLIGIPIVVIGFAFKFNPMLVVCLAGLVTGLATGIDFFKLIEIFGEKFLSSRQLSSTLLILPVIGLCELYGLRQRAQEWVASIRGATTGRILMLYFFVREVAAAIGLTSLGGQERTVRPLLAPMSEAAAIKEHGALPPELRDRIAAHAAACDNIALFFGEDVFIAFGAVLLMTSFFQDNGIHVEPLQIGLWGIPTAVAALIIHLIRLARIDAEIARDIQVWKAKQKELEMAA